MSANAMNVEMRDWMPVMGDVEGSLALAYVASEDHNSPSHPLILRGGREIPPLRIRGGEEGLRVKLLSIAHERGLGDVTTLLARLSDDQVTKVLRATGSWKKFLERNGLGGYMPSVCEERLSATDRALLTLAALAHSGDDVGKIASHIKPDANGAAVPSPAVFSGSVGSIGFRSTLLQVLR